MATVKELKQAIVEAVATLDESDGSRTSTAHAIDVARDTLADAYGDSFDADVEEYLGIETTNDDDDDEAEDEDEDE